MSSSNRQTALAVARARFLDSLPRRASELRSAALLLRSAPSDERIQEEIRRKLQALWASAQVFRMDALADAVGRALEVLENARDRRETLSTETIDELALLALALPNIAQSSATLASERSALTALIDEGSHQREVVLPTKERLPIPQNRLLLVLGGEELIEPLREGFGGELSVHGPAHGEEAARAIRRLGPDMVLLAKEWEPQEMSLLEALCQDLEIRVQRLGKGPDAIPWSGPLGELIDRLRMLFGEVTDPSALAVSRRKQRFEEALREGLFPASMRWVGEEAWHWIEKAACALGEGSLRIESHFDVFDVEIALGIPHDAVRTTKSGSFFRGKSVLQVLLALREGRIWASPGPARRRGSIAEPEPAWKKARLWAQAIDRWAHPEKVSQIALLECEEEALPSALRAKSLADEELLKAIGGGKEVKRLLEEGTPPERIAWALKELARWGAIRKVQDGTGRDLWADAMRELEEEEGAKSAAPQDESRADERDNQGAEATQE
ncbi:MAG: hypothetical protein N2515_05425, partial [Deltaproteobacteria bacterium]|nr:hypothetical protein [Deltaproteobacteria bacterium]